jgi:hypothetical protein
LEQDFVIAQHNISYNTRRFNGSTQQRTILYLTLYPKRSGDLIIPPLNIGSETSKSIKLHVVATPPPNTSILNKFATEPTYTSNWDSKFTNPNNTIATYSSSNQDFRTKSYTESVPNVELTNHTSKHDSICLWFTSITTLGWLATAIAWWYQQHSFKFSSIVNETNKPASKDTSALHPPLEILIADIKQAYQDIDPFAARNALLRWAARMWHDDPPTNLSRLAARSNPQLQRAILMLEQALYSPESVAWHKQPVWEFIEHS